MDINTLPSPDMDIANAPRMSPKRILFVYYEDEKPECQRLAMKHHIRVLEHSLASHEIEYYNAWKDAPDWSCVDDDHVLRRTDLLSRQFDAVILHYSFVGMRAMGLPFYRWKRQFEWLAEFECTKVALPNDEGSYAGVLDEWLFELGVSVIFSVHHAEDRPLYPLMREYAEILPCLPGYIDETVARSIEPQLKLIADRHVDIAYRARSLPYWVGSVGQRKSQIAQVVRPRAEQRGLRCDISTSFQDTIYGRNWLDFLASAKSVIGVEGGYSAIDWHGEARAKLDTLERRHGELPFDEYDRAMPEGWDNHQLLTITPRHFECVVTKTAQVLLEGDYKNILIPGRHFLVLRRDWSNLDEVLDQLSDSALLQEMVDRTYEEIFLSGRYTYRHFAAQIDEALERNANRDRLTSRPEPEHHMQYEKIMQKQMIAQRHHSALLHQKIEEAEYRMHGIVQQAVSDSIEYAARAWGNSSNNKKINLMLIALSASTLAVAVVILLLLVFMLLQ